MMISIKFNNFSCLLFLTLFIFFSCSSGGDDDSPSINDTWKMEHFTEWNSEDSECDVDIQSDTSLYWKIEGKNKLTKYVKLSEALGGVCNARTYTIVFEGSTITVKEGGESGTDKEYRYKLSSDKLELFDDDESVEECQEKLEFSRVKDETEFESIVENCISI